MEGAESETVGREERETIVEAEARQTSEGVLAEAVSGRESQENVPEEQKGEETERDATEGSEKRGEGDDVGSEEVQREKGEEGLNGESGLQKESRPETVEVGSESDDTSEEDEEREEEDGGKEEEDGERGGLEAASRPGSSRWGSRDERLKRLRELHKRRVRRLWEGGREGGWGKRVKKGRTQKE